MSDILYYMFRFTSFIATMVLVACVNVDNTYDVDETSTSDGGSGGTASVVGHYDGHANNHSLCSGATTPIKVYDLNGGAIVVNVPVPCDPEFIPNNDGDPEPYELQDEFIDRSFPSY